jgi:hypothetical protein
MAFSSDIAQRPHHPAHVPGGPWMAKKQWAAGRVYDNSRGPLILVWIITLIWNTVTWSIVLSDGRRQLVTGKPESYIMLLFPAIGLIPLAIAIYLTVRHLKFGRSVLELETVPGCVGGWLAGTIRTSVALRDHESVRVALRCVRRVTRGSGKNRRTSESTLWEDEQTLIGKLAADRDGGNAIPVAFRIPGSCEPTRDRHRDDIIWRLRVRAAMPGADYAADFTVPVFVEQQPENFVPQVEALAARLRASRAAVVALDDPQIEISVNVAGRKRLVFPTRRNRGTAVVVTLFAIVFGGIGIGAGVGGAPIIFPIAFGGFGAALAYGAAIYWFRHVELFVDRHGIERHWRMLGFAGTRRINAGDIVDIKSKITAEANDTPYHTVCAVVADGKEVALVSNLRTSDAAHVVEEIMNSLGSTASVAR